MRLNTNTVLLEHVPVYHEWMQSPFLQETTASEPLTLEEEYEMQQSWALDEEKLTFILLDRTQVLKDCPHWPRLRVEPFAGFGLMVGDVNLYRNDHDDAGVGEVEIMIAEEGARRRGLAVETLAIFLDYCQRVVGIKRFVAKISMTNHASLCLFKEKLGFVKVGESAVFQEETLELEASRLGVPDFESIEIH
ncbi:N-acetyltransferase 9 [Kappamyces sp. JEL0829]|nr:N-acetyltransferase 9 [Kappamyces sp. JEL0829]